MDRRSRPTRDDLVDAIREVLAEMGATAPEPERPLLPLDRATGPSILGSDRRFDDFMTRVCLRFDCIPYPIGVVRGLSVEDLAERLLLDSYPAPPLTALPDDALALSVRTAGPPRAVFEPCRAPLCFVLAVGRSGTTIFQAMLNRHPALWAPGELHLALFDTMSERASAVSHPFLRQAFAPEAADRLGESVEGFTSRLEVWERDSTPTVDVYATLAAADATSLVVDKTPDYARHPSDLEWIRHHFPAARFVHLVRDPTDVAGSFVRMQLHRQAAEPAEVGLAPHHRAEAMWFRHNANIVSMLEDVPSTQWCRIRYEDLVQDPGSTLEPVCRVLGIDYVDQMADPYAERTGPVARGAGDPSVNRRDRVERATATGSTFPLSGPTRRLAAELGYDTSRG